MADGQEIPPQIAVLSQDSATAQAVRIETKRRLLKQRYDQLRAEHEIVKKELAEIKSRPADKTVEQLRIELAEIKHRKVFDSLARDAKIRPQALEDLWKLGDFKIDPYVDTVDADALREVIQQYQKEKPYMFGEDAPPTPAPETNKNLPPGPGMSRGGLVRDTGKFRIARSQLRNMTPTLQATLAKEYANNNVEIIEG